MTWLGTHALTQFLFASAAEMFYFYFQVRVARPHASSGLVVHEIVIFLLA